MISKVSTKHLVYALCALVVVFSAAAFAAPGDTPANVVIEHGSEVGIIRGIVRDDAGGPIAEATVAIFRAGTSTLLKQVTSDTAGRFVAKIIPGTYTVLAVAQGFNPVTIFGVEVGRSADLNYGFKLERAGEGNTLPEKRTDRNSSKWRIRAAQTQRSIYQNQQGNPAAVAKVEAEQEAEAEAEAEPDPHGRKDTAVLETHFTATKGHGSYAGVNFATLVPISNKVDIIVAGQTGRGKNAPQRLETAFRVRTDRSHDLRFNSSVGILGTVTDTQQRLGQVSFQAIDEWKIRDGVIVVLGVDYSKFFDGGSDSSLTPRLGLQFDADSKTRFSTALTTETETRSWANPVDLEGESYAFAEPMVVEDLVVLNDKPRMNKTRRIEFGVERILDNKSTIEANAFADTTFGRGVGLNQMAFDTLGENAFSEFVGDQQGRAEGIRIVYTRRITSRFTTAAGYSFGRGQELAPSALTEPSNVFQDANFQTFFGRVSADLSNGTNVQTILRLSPQATVFAIDPFKGRLAIYDPGLSILVTQSLPTLGLPIHAQAIIDARNIFDFQPTVTGEEGSISLNAQRRMLRGGIQVRF